MAIVYFPVGLYWLYLAIRARSFFFFTAANPGIYTGGMLGERKSDIDKLIPKEYLPKSLLFSTVISKDVLLDMLAENGLEYPLICKPNVGERGLGVEKVEDEKGLFAYFEKYGLHAEILVQEFLKHPLEFAVLYVRIPGEERGRITSLTMKKFMSVEGDGVSNVAELMLKEERSLLQVAAWQLKNPERISMIPAKGEVILLEPIGNHCRGTAFIDARHLVDEQMERSFDALTAKIKGVYLCRYDLKCGSLEALKEGRDIKIMEINGVGAEPAHIYDAKWGICEKWRAGLQLWYDIFKVAVTNHQKGVPYMGFKEAKECLYTYQAYIKKLNSL